MAAISLGRTAMPAPVMGNHAIAVVEEGHHLRVPIIGRQRPTVTEHDGLAGSPVVVMTVWSPFPRRDFTEDLRKIKVPVLVMHGDDDQIVPYADPAPLSAKLLANGTLKTYKGFPHGMPTTEAATINADLLTFIKISKQAAA